MIISHQHRFIFFAVPRTATHSLRYALRGHLGPNDWEQQMLTARRALPIPELAAIGHGHISLREAYAHLPGGICGSYFKFAFVRNPFDRFVSVCCFLNRNNPDFPGNELIFMKRALSRPQFRRRVLATPQSQLLVDERGEAGMDYIGRYETLQASYDQLCGRIGLPPSALTENNASRHDTCARYYDDELATAVRDFYHADFSAFGYPLWPGEPGTDFKRSRTDFYFVR